MGSTAVLADPISITIDNTPLIGGGGTILTFDATMTNTTGGALNLNGDNFSFAPAFATAKVDDSAFFTAWPAALAAGQTFGSDALFSIFIPRGTALGTYDGIFAVVGGAGLNDQNLLGSAAFQFTVAPEPGTLSLTLLGMVGLAAISLKRLHA
jgi:hypothetical protein